MCDPAEDELGRAQDEAIDLAETKKKLEQRIATMERATVSAVAVEEAQKLSRVIRQLPPTDPFPQAAQPFTQVPSVGRDVHWVAYGTPGGEFPAGAHRAAKITEVRTNGLDATLGIVSLCVFNPTGLWFNQNVPYDVDKTPGTWHWPERV